MIARFAGGMLGLFAFGVAATIGLAVGNPPMVVMTRAIWALLIFCMVGLAVGAAAQAAINEYVTAQEEALRSPAGERAAADPTVSTVGEATAAGDARPAR